MFDLDTTKQMHVKQAEYERLRRIITSDQYLILWFDVVSVSHLVICPWSRNSERPYQGVWINHQSDVETDDLSIFGRMDETDELWSVPWFTIFQIDKGNLGKPPSPWESWKDRSPLIDLWRRRALRGRERAHHAARLNPGRTNLAIVLPSTESPIENALLRAFTAVSKREMIPQYQIGPYRVDFAIRSPRRIIIECDGHEWHERTKEQAAKDKARDRQLQRLGWMVLRYTGSEIYHDAAACAREIRDILEEK